MFCAPPVEACAPSHSWPRYAGPAGFCPACREELPARISRGNPDEEQAKTRFGPAVGRLSGLLDPDHGMRNSFPTGLAGWCRLTTAFGVFHESQEVLLYVTWQRRRRADT